MTTQNYQIPKGKGGSAARELQEKYNVKIVIPKREEASNTITLIGKVSDVEKAKAHIEKLLGFSISNHPIIKSSLDIPKEKHGSLIGKGGSILKDLQNHFGVVITIPKRGDDSSIITLEGYETGIKGAKENIEKLVGTNQVSDKGEVEEKPVQIAKLDLTKPINEAFFFPEETDAQFKKFLHYLRSATKSLDICVFTITDDAISRVIEECFGEGIKVRIITDDDTSAQQGSDIEEFRKLGIAVKMDHTPYHMHHKFVVIDDIFLINGSFNWTKQARENNNENMMLTNNKEFVQLYSAQFKKMWNDTAHFS